MKARLGRCGHSGVGLDRTETKAGGRLKCSRERPATAFSFNSMESIEENVTTSAR
jgi:hypothetical protein